MPKRNSKTRHGSNGWERDRATTRYRIGQPGAPDSMSERDHKEWVPYVWRDPARLSPEQLAQLDLDDQPPA